MLNALGFAPRQSKKQNITYRPVRIEFVSRFVPEHDHCFRCNKPYDQLFFNKILTKSVAGRRFLDHNIEVSFLLQGVCLTCRVTQYPLVSIYMTISQVLWLLSLGFEHEWVN